ncbi:inactive serine protease PAMR1 isoform X2 [Paramormyrops kingsleyae]|uniref:inactive serine protease PAMR1 isoform X2 n=1 Tax=Paramormyrops kingsleyae TaxID=1676925 RepID=UPI003B970AB1
MLSAGRQLVALRRGTRASPCAGSGALWHLLLLLLVFVARGAAWPRDYRFWYDSCPGSEWSIMCQGCCEYDLIRCKCPTQGSPVGYAVPCCRNAVNECDPCIIHPGCSIFENCKRCNNGTWVAKDDFFVRGKYCAECRPGWSGGDCMRCGGVIRKAQGHVVLESYPTNARCEWTLQVEKDFTIELSFRMISLEFDYSCRYDYIEVRDGDGLSSRVIGRFCGNERPPPILSSGNSLHILFVSDGYKNFDGFFATFQESSACSSSPCRHDGTCVLDSLGSYRCACLAGYTGRHCENVLVEKKSCPIPEKPASGDYFLVYGPEDVLIAVQYLCHSPYMLKGQSQSSCLPNSTWSGPAPLCVKVKEVDKEQDKEHDKEKGLGKDKIPSSTGHKDKDGTKGSISKNTTSEKDLGKESVTDNLSVHESERHRCPLPSRLLNGYHQLVLGLDGAPDTMEYFCNNSYALSGSAQRTCQADGSWSGKQPLCIRACREPKVSDLVRQKVLPPQAPSRLSPVQKFYSSSTVRKVYDPVVPTKGPPVLAELPQGYHHLYTHIEYECASPFYHHSGSSHRTCLKTGKWSGRHVSCSPVCGKLSSFSARRPADTLWPWHAAIYRRSSAGIASRIAKKESLAAGLGKEALGGKGSLEAAVAGADEEEETGMGGWQLVCSGALVNQRSVVVAAHCVTELGKAHPIIPADVKVVMGKHYRSELRETKSLQHLRVSAVLVHSNYDPLVLDSDLAVLKLLDKARVGERVLPVCLPDVWEGQAAAHQAYVIGWPILPGAGGTEAEGTARAGLVELADMVACERQFAQHGAAIGVTDNMLCGRQHPRALSDICPADTGGIVILPAPDHPEGLEETRRVWTLLGLVSFGYDRRACSPELYTVYTRVSSFKDWIQRNMK